jgi:hypothetical protein
MLGNKEKGKLPFLQHGEVLLAILKVRMIMEK